MAILMAGLRDDVDHHRPYSMVARRVPHGRAPALLHPSRNASRGGGRDRVSLIVAIPSNSPLSAFISCAESRVDVVRLMTPLPLSSSGAPSPPIIAAGKHHLYSVLAGFCDRHPSSEFSRVHVDAGGRAAYANVSVPLELAASLRAAAASRAGGFITFTAPVGAPPIHLRLVPLFAAEYEMHEFELGGFHGMSVSEVLGTVNCLAASTRGSPRGEFPAFSPVAVLRPKMMFEVGFPSGRHESGAFLIRCPAEDNRRVPQSGSTLPQSVAPGGGQLHVYTFERVHRARLPANEEARLLAPQLQYIAQLAAAGAGRPLETGTTFPAVSPDVATSASDMVGGAAGAAPAGVAADAAAAAVAAAPALTRKQKKRRREQAAKKAAQLRAAGGTSAPPPPAGHPRRGGLCCCGCCCCGGGRPPRGRSDWRGEERSRLRRGCGCGCACHQARLGCRRCCRGGRTRLARGGCRCLLPGRGCCLWEGRPLLGRCRCYNPRLGRRARRREGRSPLTRGCCRCCCRRCCCEGDRQRGWRGCYGRPPHGHCRRSDYGCRHCHCCGGPFCGPVGRN